MDAYTGGKQRLENNSRLKISTCFPAIKYKILRFFLLAKTRKTLMKRLHHYFQKTVTSTDEEMISN